MPTITRDEAVASFDKYGKLDMVSPNGEIVFKFRRNVDSGSVFRTIVDTTGNCSPCIPSTIVQPFTLPVIMFGDQFQFEVDELVEDGWDMSRDVVVIGG